MCGFTSMAENTSPAELAKIMSMCFSVLVDSVLRHGGDVLKFCGDAWLCSFRDSKGECKYLEQGIDASVVSACLCAMEIQGEETSLAINSEEGLEIQFKVSIALGKSYSLLCGGLHDRWDYIFMGEPIQQIRTADQLCRPGEIIIVDKAAVRLKQMSNLNCVLKGFPVTSLVVTKSQNESWRYPLIKRSSSVPCETQTSNQSRWNSLASRRYSERNLTIEEQPSTKNCFFILSSLKCVDNIPVLSAIPNEEKMSHYNRLELFLPMSVIPKALFKNHDLTKTRPFHDSMGSELQYITASFIKIQSLTEVSTEGCVDALDSLDYSLEGKNTILAQGLHDSLNIINESLHKHGGILRQILCDDKGTVAICVFGLSGYQSKPTCAPVAILSALETLQELKQQYGYDACAGIASGPAYCGVIGNHQRAEFVVLGDTVNTAARIMAFADKEGHGVVCNEAARKSSLNTDRLEFRGSERIAMKNKSSEQAVYFPSLLI